MHSRRKYDFWSEKKWHKKVTFCPSDRTYAWWTPLSATADSATTSVFRTNSSATSTKPTSGYKASKEIFDEDDFGKWKFCNDDDIRAIVGEGNPKMKIAVMADVGRTDFEEDIIPKSESPIDLVRIATYINTIPAAVEMIEYCAKQGYETTINIMAISKARTEDLKTALEILGQTPVSCFYIVDSYGHAHNNQQLAFANTIEAMAYGASYLDATVDGMGRGAGNCALELLLGFLKNPKYKVNPIIRMMQNHMTKLQEAGVKWGYDVPYMLTGQYNTHPRPAIQFIQEGRKDYYKFANDLYDIINS